MSDIFIWHDGKELFFEVEICVGVEYEMLSFLFPYTKLGGGGGQIEGTWVDRSRVRNVVSEDKEIGDGHGQYHVAMGTSSFSGFDGHCVVI